MGHHTDTDMKHVSDPPFGKWTRLLLRGEKWETKNVNVGETWEKLKPHLIDRRSFRRSYLAQLPVFSFLNPYVDIIYSLFPVYSPTSPCNNLDNFKLEYLINLLTCKMLLS